MVKKIDKLIKDVNSILEFLEARDVNYISSEGKAYIDGLRLAGYKFEFVSKENYDSLEDENIKLKQRINELNKKKHWFYK